MSRDRGDNNRFDYRVSKIDALSISVNFISLMGKY